MWRTTLLAVALAVGMVPASAQSTLDRSPDLTGGWVGEPGRLYFHFMHRFEAGPEPARKVTNTPTFTVGVPVVESALVGFNYATNSNVARGRPNEWELFGRWSPLRGGPWELAVQGGYNLGAASVDGELTLGAGAGAFRAFGVGRVLSGWRDSDEARFAAGVGARARLLDGLALAGDVVAPVDLAADESPAWSAGVQLRIPYTPHTLSLHASNAATTTLHGSTVGSGTVRYGFEFTIPVTFRRYGLASSGGEPDGTGTERPAAAPTRPGEMAAAEPGDSGAMEPGGTGATMTADTVEVDVRSLAYGTERLEIEPGTTVVWVNDDPVAHTATADDGSWDSHLIDPGKRWARTFTGPGEHTYHCTPHPFMKGVIVVASEGGMH